MSLPGECLNPNIQDSSSQQPECSTLHPHTNQVKDTTTTTTTTRSIPPWPEKKCNWNATSLLSSLRHDLNDRYPVITQNDVDRSERLYGAHARRYVILNGKLYGRDGAPGAIVGVAAFVEDMLVQLLQQLEASHATIPNVDFVLNCADHPTVANDVVQNDATLDAPVISMCGSTDYRDIVVPTYTMALVATGRSYTHYAARRPWHERIEKLVWRGSDSNYDRFAFNILANSAKYINDTDVGMSQMVRLPHDIRQHGPVRDYIPEGQFGDYKWIANIDGAVAAYRMPAVMALGSTVVLQESPYYEHWYRHLQPYVHYVPMAHDFSNLSDVLSWLKTHDNEAKRIGEAGRAFVLEHLQADSIQCYWYAFLHEYAARLTYTPTVLDGMTAIG
jgi:Glycosyl transferase family 90